MSTTTKNKSKSSTPAPRSDSVLSALSDDMRRQMLRLIKQPTSAKMVHIALKEKEIEVPLPNISYHMKILREAGLLKLTGTAQRRGAVESFYVQTPDTKRIVARVIKVAEELDS
jgi:DNA-binding transcriptional ArsR family regulator